MPNIPYSELREGDVALNDIQQRFPVKAVEREGLNVIVTWLMPSRTTNTQTYDRDERVTIESH